MFTHTLRSHPQSHKLTWLIVHQAKVKLERANEGIGEKNLGVENLDLHHLVKHLLGTLGEVVVQHLPHTKRFRQRKGRTTEREGRTGERKDRRKGRTGEKEGQVREGTTENRS